MSKDPAVLWYTSDFLTGTSRFSDEDVGKYTRALCNQHQCGHFTKEELFGILKSYDSPVWKKFAKAPDGKFYNIRMDKEIIDRVEYCNSRSHKGISGRKPKDASNHTNIIRKSYDIPYGNHTEDEDKDVIKDIKKEDIKGKTKKFIPPSMEEVIKYFTDNGYSKEKGEQFFKGYDVAGWRDSRNNKILNWKQKALHVWFRPEDKTGYTAEPEEHVPTTPWEKLCEKNSEPGVVVFDRVGTLFGIDNVHAPEGGWPPKIYDGCAKEVFDFMLTADKSKKEDNLKKVNSICDKWKAKINVKP
jgi:hypothetical protein